MSRDMIVSPAPYLPFLDPVKGSPPGLWALDLDSWIEIDSAYAAQMAYRDRLIRTEGAEVADAVLGAEAAVAELGAVLAAHLERVLSAHFERTSDGIRRPDGVVAPLPSEIAALGRLVQEDFCLLAKPPDGDEHVLIAANLCFPSHWRLAEKIGRPLTAVHEPVPAYAEALGRRVERVHAALHVDRPLQRLNYSVIGTPELRLVGARSAEERFGPFYLRVERQTLRRLPESRAVVFTIKSYLTPFADLEPEARRGLRDRLLGWSPDVVAYKGGAETVANACAALSA